MKIDLNQYDIPSSAWLPKKLRDVESRFNLGVCDAYIPLFETRYEVNDSILFLTQLLMKRNEFDRNIAGEEIQTVIDEIQIPAKCFWVSGEYRLGYGRYQALGISGYREYKNYQIIVIENGDVIDWYSYSPEQALLRELSKHCEMFDCKNEKQMQKISAIAEKLSKNHSLAEELPFTDGIPYQNTSFPLALLTETISIFGQSSEEVQFLIGRPDVLKLYEDKLFSLLKLHMGQEI